MCIYTITEWSWKKGPWCHKVRDDKKFVCALHPTCEGLTRHFFSLLTCHYSWQTNTYLQVRMRFLLEIAFRQFPRFCLPADLPEMFSGQNGPQWHLGWRRISSGSGSCSLCDRIRDRSDLLWLFNLYKLCKAHMRQKSIYAMLLCRRYRNLC